MFGYVVETSCSCVCFGRFAPSAEYRRRTCRDEVQITDMFDCNRAVVSERAKRRTEQQAGVSELDAEDKTSVQSCFLGGGNLSNDHTHEWIRWVESERMSSARL